jgi:hypothetical protein
MIAIIPGRAPGPSQARGRRVTVPTGYPAPCAAVGADQYDQSSLVPDDVDDQSVAPFIYLTLATLGARARRGPA